MDGPTDTPRSLGKILRFRHEQAGLTLEAVEDRLEVRDGRWSASALSELERGDSTSDEVGLHALMRLFELPETLIDDLLDLESRGIEIPDPGEFDTMLDRARRAWNDGNSDEGMAWFLALQHLCTDADPRSKRLQIALQSLAQAIARDGRLEPARHILDRVLAVGLHPDLRVRTYVLASQLWGHSGNLDAATAFLDRAVASARPDDHEAYAWTLHQRALLELDKGRPDEADRAARHALRHYRKTARRRNETTCRLLRVRILRAAGRAKDAVREARAVAHAAQKQGFDRVAVSASLQVGRSLVAAGRAAEALEILRDGLEEARRRKYDAQVFDARVNLWFAHRALGNEQEARAAMIEASTHSDFLDFRGPDVLELRRALEKLQAERTDPE